MGAVKLLDKQSSSSHLGATNRYSYSSNLPATLQLAPVLFMSINTTSVYFSDTSYHHWQCQHCAADWQRSSGCWWFQNQVSVVKCGKCMKNGKIPNILFGMESLELTELMKLLQMFYVFFIYYVDILPSVRELKVVSRGFPSGDVFSRHWPGRSSPALLQHDSCFMCLHTMPKAPQETWSSSSRPEG